MAELKGRVLNLGKILKAALQVDSSKGAQLQVSLPGESKLVDLTSLEAQQFAAVINRSGLVELEDANDIINDAAGLTETIAEQARALDGTRNQLAAAVSAAEQMKGALTLLETKTAELETKLAAANAALDKSQADGATAEATITELRAVIAGLQTTVDDLTEKLKNATVVEDGGAATVVSVVTDGTPDATPPAADTTQPVVPPTQTAPTQAPPNPDTVPTQPPPPPAEGTEQK